MSFPIDLSKYQRVAIDPWAQATLTAEQKAALSANVELCRDAIVFFTACGSASGYGGHTGGAYDTVPEVVILDAFFRARPDKFIPIFFDEAGHRVATQYLMSVLNGDMKAEHLMKYRAGHTGLPGHPELGATPGVKFSSGRLGHMWPFVNGVAMANEGKTAICLGSDGSQQEGLASTPTTPHPNHPNYPKSSSVCLARFLSLQLYFRVLSYNQKCL